LEATEIGFAEKVIEFKFLVFFSRSEIKRILPTTANLNDHIVFLGHIRLA
jgi:hypothetical protein